MMLLNNRELKVMKINFQEEVNEMVDRVVKLKDGWFDKRGRDIEGLYIYVYAIIKVVFDYLWLSLW